MPLDTSPYTGKEPFIFISYAHRDDQRVLPVIHKLLAAGFRIWYDDAIEKGREWDNDIARHVRDCAVFIPFFTENYLASRNCKNELRYALSKNRSCLAVFLEKLSFENDPGLEMYIYVNQNIMAQSMETDTIFQKIAEVPLLQQCLILPESEPAPQSQAETASSAPVQPEMPRETPAEKAPAPAAQTAAPKFGPIRWIIWILLLLYTLLLVLTETRNSGYTNLVASAGSVAILVGLHLFAGFAGLAAIAVTEARHRVKREKNSPGLLLRGSVTCLNIMIAVLLITHGDSVLWQILAGALAAAGFLFGGLRIGRLRQLDGKSGMMCIYAAAWRSAAVVLFMIFDYYSKRIRQFRVSEAVQFAALTGFLAVTLFFAIRAFRKKETGRGKFITQIAVLVLLFAVTVPALIQRIIWCINYYSVLRIPC